MDKAHPEPKEPNRRKILCVSASPRAGGNTDALLAELARGAEDAGAEADIAYLRDYSINPCIGCEQCRRDKTCTQFYDGMHLLYPRIEESAGIVLGSPTYNYNITGSMKNFIDRFYPYFDFENPRPGPYRALLGNQHRAAAVVGVCEQREESQMGFTMPAMSDAIRAIGYQVVAEVPVLGHFSRGSVGRDEDSLRRAYEAGAELAGTLIG